MWYIVALYSKSEFFPLYTVYTRVEKGRALWATTSANNTVSDSLLLIFDSMNLLSKIQQNFNSFFFVQDLSRYILHEWVKDS